MDWPHGISFSGRRRVVHAVGKCRRRQNHAGASSRTKYQPII
jgi:hypothetical protein